MQAAVIVDGMESMSQAPHLLRAPRTGASASGERMSRMKAAGLEPEATIGDYVSMAGSPTSAALLERLEQVTNVCGGFGQTGAILLKVE